MTPIFCCGETLETYEAGKTAEWIQGQITNGLVGLSNEQVASMVIAYEPIWAIGTGKSADANIADEIVVLFVQQLKNYTAKKFQKLYVFNTVVQLNQKNRRIDGKRKRCGRCFSRRRKLRSRLIPSFIRCCKIRNH